MYIIPTHKNSYDAVISKNNLLKSQKGNREEKKYTQNAKNRTDKKKAESCSNNSNNNNKCAYTQFARLYVQWQVTHTFSSFVVWWSLTSRTTTHSSIKLCMNVVCLCYLFKTKGTATEHKCCLFAKPIAHNTPQISSTTSSYAFLSLVALYCTNMFKHRHTASK